MSEQTIGTTCVQGGYHPGDAEPRQVPIYQSTTWKYDTSEHMGKLFDLEESGYFYSRLQNPTCDLVAAKICEMEEAPPRCSRARAWLQTSSRSLTWPVPAIMWSLALPFTAVRITCSPTPWAAWA